MAASIESRVPFLDHPLVEFTATLPERLKLRGLHDQVRAPRGDARPAPAPRSCRAARWAFPCRSAAGSAASYRGSRRVRARRARAARAGSSTRRTSGCSSPSTRREGATTPSDLCGCWSTSRSGTGSSSTASRRAHVSRRLRARTGRRRARCTSLWLKTELLHPIDKGGRIRTYHMLRSAQAAAPGHLPHAR